MLLSIDPGVTSGWALFINNTLATCGIWNLIQVADTLASHEDDRSKEKVFEAHSIRVVIEKPRIYPGGRTKNPNDVLSVAINAGEWCGVYRAHGLSPEYVEPRTWKKGNVKKEIQNNRDWAKLSALEQAIVAAAEKQIPKSKREHMRDAIGIGLWALARGTR